MEQPDNKGRRIRTNLRTSISARIRSKPSNVSQQYLDLYTLKRDRARWTRAKERAEQMIRGIDKALAKLEPSLKPQTGQAHTAVRAPGTIDLKMRAGPNAAT